MFDFANQGFLTLLIHTDLRGSVPRVNRWSMARIIGWAIIALSLALSDQCSLLVVVATRYCGAIMDIYTGHRRAFSVDLLPC